MKQLMITAALALVLVSCGDSGDASTETNQTGTDTGASSTGIESGSAKGNSNLDNPGAGLTLDTEGNSTGDSATQKKQGNTDTTSRH